MRPDASSVRNGSQAGRVRETSKAWRAEAAPYVWRTGGRREKRGALKLCPTCGARAEDE